MASSRLFFSATTAVVIVAGVLFAGAPANAVPTSVIAVGAFPFGIALSPDGATAYVTNNGSGNVSEIDTATGIRTHTIIVGAGPYGVAVSPNGSSVFVTNNDDNSVSVIDTATHLVTFTYTASTVPGGFAGPYSVAISPDSKTAYVTNNDAGTVSVLDTAAKTLIATIPVGLKAFSVTLSPNGATAYVSNNGDHTVSEIDTATNKVTHVINVGNGPYGVAVSPDDSTVYVTNNDDNTVETIDVASHLPTFTYHTGFAGPYSVAISPDGANAYVTNNDAGTVSVLDTASKTVAHTIDVGTKPFGIALNALGDKGYVVNTGAADNEGDSNVSVLSLTALATGTPAEATQGQTFTFAVPGSNVASYAVTAGTLPAGLTLDAATGIISGASSLVGQSTFTITGTGMANNSFHAYEISTIAAPKPVLAATGTNGTLLGLAAGTSALLILLGIAAGRIRRRRVA
jgi:YVTN family beta-propeller protein